MFSQLYSQKDIFKDIKRKHWKDIYNILWSFTKLEIKYNKIKLDIEYIKLWKQENLLPTFAEVRLSILIKNNKLKERIGTIIMEHRLEKIHYKNSQLRKEIKSISIQLETPFSFIVYSVSLNRWFGK